MTIKVGDQIPSMKLMMGTPDGPKETSTDEVFKGKKVVLVRSTGSLHANLQRQAPAELRAERGCP